MKYLEVKCYDDCNLLQTTLVKHKINEAKVAKCSSLNVGDRKSAFPTQFFLLPHIFKNDQNQNKMNTYIYYILGYLSPVLILSLFSGMETNSLKKG